MDSRPVQGERQPVLEYAPPPTAPRPTVAQYVSASIRAAVMFVITSFVIGGFFGQSLKEIDGWWRICAAIAIYAIPTGIAISSFKAHLSGGRRQVRY